MKSRVRHSSAIHAGIDGMCALALALASAVYGNMARIPAGNLRQFLELRVTLLNVIFAAGFVLSWISCCSALGLYQQHLLSGLRMLRRAAQACALTAIGLGVFLYISRTAGPIVHIAIFFLISSLIFETLRLLGGGGWLVSGWPRATRTWWSLPGVGDRRPWRGARFAPAIMPPSSCWASWMIVRWARWRPMLPTATWGQWTSWMTFCCATRSTSC